ncbi:MAG: hypothetical protein H6714_07065 [Myxococcales bacterium]|nr:hypothetical protein [Myxococcales bacterium]
MTVKRVTIVVNDRRETQERLKTWLLANEALSRGYQVHACGVSDLEATQAGGVWVNAQVLRAPSVVEPRILVDPGLCRYALGASEMVWIRSNPGRDREHAQQHEAALHLLSLAKRGGTFVLNDPDVLLRFSSKTYLMGLPEAWVPESLVSRDISHMLAFAETLDAPFIVKPLNGSRGEGIFFFESAGHQNLRSVLEIVSAEDYAIVQRFIPEARHEEYRVFYVRGVPLSRKKRTLAVLRKAAHGDFRNNVHAGARDSAITLPSSYDEVARSVGQFLIKQGLFWAGVDLSGAKVVEINTFSPGGWDRSERFPHEFSRAIVDAIEAEHGVWLDRTPS